MHNKNSLSEIVCSSWIEDESCYWSKAIYTVWESRLGKGLWLYQVGPTGRWNFRKLSELSYYASVLVYQGTQGIGWSDRPLGFKLNYTPCQHCICWNNSSSIMRLLWDLNLYIIRICFSDNVAVLMGSWVLLIYFSSLKHNYTAQTIRMALIMKALQYLLSKNFYILRRYCF